MDKYYSAWLKLSVLFAAIYLIAMVIGITHSTFTLFSYAFNIYFDLIGVVPLVGLIIWIMRCIHAKTQIWTSSDYLFYSVSSLITVACAGFLTNILFKGNSGLYFTASLTLLVNVFIFAINHLKKNHNDIVNQWFTDDNMMEMSVYNGFICAIYTFSSGIVTINSLTGGGLMAIAVFIGAFLASLVVYSFLWYVIGISKWAFSGFHVFKNPNK